ncbi:MAG: PAS domain S-box protein, partial [Thermodesulfobacteriota bacterium]
MGMEKSLGLSLDGTIIRFGVGLEELLGYTVEEVRGRVFTELLPEGGRKAFLSLIEKVRTGGLETGHRAAVIRKDGSLAELFLSVYPLRELNGAVNSFVVLFRTRKSDDTPAIFSDEFQRIFRFSNDAVMITDTDGNILDVNTAFLDTYGYAREEVLGRNPRILKSQHSTGELCRRMWADILDPAKGYWRGEIINLAKDGTEVPVLLSISAIKDREGKIRNFLGIALNISRQKEMDRTSRIYIDYIVHDIRGPLTTIMTNAELLYMRLGNLLDEKAKKKLRVIFD